MINQLLSNLTRSALVDTAHRAFKTPLDDWASPCELLRDENYSFWRPVPQVPKMSFDGFERAIEAPLHEDVKAFYSGFWSGALPGTYQGRAISLIQIWNPDDFERLISNLVGHFLAQKRAKIRFSVFLGTLDFDDELCLSLDNSNGEVFWERPGQGKVESVADSLGRFLEEFSLQTNQLNPVELPSND